MKALILALIALSPMSALAGTTEECGAIEASVPYKYCITRTIGSQNTDVLYYLHGGSGNEHQWLQSNLRIQEAWQKSGFQAPVVVTISFGPGWLLVESNTAPMSGLLEVFRDSIMPKMESLAIGKSAVRRLLMGASMGSFNAIQLLTKLPPNTFARAFLGCPAILGVSPWASQEEIDSYLKKNGEPPGSLDGLIAFVKAHVADETLWNSSVSPVQLAISRGLNMVPSLVAVNSDDRLWGQGGRTFAAAAVKAGAAVKLEIRPGEHCEMNNDGVLATAAFLK